MVSDTLDLGPRGLPARTLGPKSSVQRDDDDESTDINAPRARPRESERPVDSLTRPNITISSATIAKVPPPPLPHEDMASLDDGTDVTDVTIARKRPPISRPPSGPPSQMPSQPPSATDENAQTIARDEPTTDRPPFARSEPPGADDPPLHFNFSVPLGPNDTIIPTRPRGNVAAYDALIKSTQPGSEPPPQSVSRVDISAFPDPSQFAVPEDAPTLDRPTTRQKSAPLKVSDMETTQALSGEDLEVVGDRKVASSRKTDELESMATSDSRTNVLSKNPVSSQTGISVEIPAHPVHETHAEQRAEQEEYSRTDANATVVPSSQMYEALVRGISQHDMDSTSEGDRPTLLNPAATDETPLRDDDDYDNSALGTDSQELLTESAEIPELPPRASTELEVGSALVDEDDLLEDEIDDGDATDVNVGKRQVSRESVDVELGSSSTEVRVGTSEISLAELEEEHDDDADTGVQLRQRVPRKADDDNDAIEYDDDDDTGATANEELPARPAVQKSIAPAPIKSATYRPPPLAETRAGGFVPAFEVDQDAEERRLTQNASWEALIETYLSRVQNAPSWTAKAKLFAKIASVFETKLNDPEQALDALLEAFELSPVEESAAKGIERLAGPLNRWRDIIERAKVKLQSPVPEGRLALIARLAHWYDIGMQRRDLAAPYLEQIEKIDRHHPLLLRRNAARAKEQGDPRAEKDALERLLDTAQKPEEKVEVLMMLARVSGTGPIEALRYFERAFSLDPKNADVLQAIEKNGEDQEKFGQVEWALGELIANARSNESRIAHHLRLASFYERRMLKRDLAALDLEKVLSLDNRNQEALSGLERCYRALQSWHDLARTLERRADVANDAVSRVNLLLTAAEVHELKNQDTKNAIKCLKRVLGVDPSHKKALDLAARLSQKIEDWPDVTKYRQRLAEIEPTPRAKAVQYTQLADVLSGPAKDEMAAMRYYQLAVDIDPRNMNAWEALTRAARASGDAKKLMRVLEQRAEHTTMPRVRAQVLVELAETRRGLGDEAGMAAAYESAVQADKTNEDAAAFTLDRYVREGKWKQAQPLVELLVNAAVRDNETTQLIGRLRLATRIAASQGDVQKAVSAAVQAYDARPDDPGSRGDLLDLCLQLKKRAQIEKATAAVERIANRITELTPEELGKLGRVMLLLGQADEAVEVCSRALAADPNNRAATAALGEACAAKGDWAGACDCKVSLARTAKDSEERFKLLCEAGELWQNKAKDLTMAREVWEQALAIKERDRWLLHAMMKLYGDLEAWDKLTVTLFTLAEIQENAVARAKSLFLAAQVFAEKIGDLERAAEVYDLVIESDKTRLDAFEQIVRIYTTRRDWQALDRSYRKMLARMKDGTDKNLVFELWKQLGIIYRDRLGEVDKAREALKQADKLRPTDVELRKMMTELDVVTDNVDNAIARCRAKIRENPDDGELYSEIYELFLRKHTFDRAWCALNVLAQFRELEGQAAQFYVDYPPFHPANIPGQLTESAWSSHIFHPGIDAMLTRIFAIMTPLVARVRALAPGAQELARSAVALGPQHTQIANALYRAFRDACEILNLSPPELLAAQGAGTAPPFVPAIIPFGALYVNGAAIETQVESMHYLVAKRLAEQRPELTAKAFFPTITELRTLLATGVRIANGAPPKDAQSAMFDQQLRSVMSWEDAERLRRTVLEATQAGSLFDVKRWAQMCDLSSTRAGLVLCGDVTQARRAIQKELQAPTDLSPREKIGELYTFATSDEYADLRGAIGVAVGSES